MSKAKAKAATAKPKNPASLDAITSKLKSGPEQQTVVGPLVAQLVKIGWHLNQIVFGKHEWRVPTSPSEATKREKGQSFSGFPVDIAIFDSVKNAGDAEAFAFHY